jgi:AraC family transcriptional regulator
MAAWVSQAKGCTRGGARFYEAGSPLCCAVVALSDRNRLEYEKRVNRVIDYIQDHRAEDLSLETLAQIAAFSPFHFHRIFKAVTGENLKEFVQRLRLEWAGSTLVFRPQADVTEIALDSGFQSASAFARAFKERFGMTATEWRSGGAADWSKSRLAVRNPGQADSKACAAGDRGDPHPDAMNVTVQTLPSYPLAYMRYTGPYGAQSGIPQLWLKLQRWAAARDLWTPDRLCVGIAYDDPRVTDPDRCRYDAGIVLPAGVDVSGDAQVNTAGSPAGKYALAPFEGTARDIAPCWDRVFSHWLPQSGYQPDDGPCMELYRGDAVDMATGVVRCDLCTPVRPL